MGWLPAKRLRHAVAIGLIGAVACGVSGETPAATRPACLAPLEVEVLGEAFEWRFRYPGPDCALGTADDRVAEHELHLPQGTQVTLRLRSRDYVYRFKLPALGLRAMAIPDIQVDEQVRPLQVARTALKGDQMCGRKHSGLLGTLVVEPPSAFNTWLQQGVP